MNRTVSALLAGFLFGLGLILSEMVNPKRVQGFLDITGSWDPTLAFVMGGALVVTSIGYKLIFARGRPMFESIFSVPTNRIIDKRLVLGGVLFGAGWGLSGLCPGPAVVALSTFNMDVVVFVISMIIGMKTFELVKLS